MRISDWSSDVCSSDLGDVAAQLVGWHDLGGPLQVHDVDVVVLHVLLQRGNQLGALRVGHGDEVLDGHGVEHLAAEALSDDAGADPLAGCVDGGGGAGGAAADPKHHIGKQTGRERVGQYV